MSKGHLKRIQNSGQGFCVRCSSNFKENDLVATSTSQRYCYSCATKINLVTGDINKDLNNSEFISEILKEITQITNSICASEHITSISKLIVKTAFENMHHISRNKRGIASAAIYLAHEIEFERNSGIEKLLPVSKMMLARNLYPLQRSMKHTNLYTITKTIHGVRK